MLQNLISKSVIVTKQNWEGGCPRGVMVKVLDSGIVVSNVHFRTYTLRKCINPLFLPAMGYIVPQLFFSKDGIGIK